MQQAKYTFLISFLVLLTIPAMAQREISLEELKTLVLENNRELKIAKEHTLAARSLRKSSFTHFLPGFDIQANYLRLNKPFNLLAEDLLLPVIPISAIDPETSMVDPNRLFSRNISPPPTGVVFKPNSSDYFTDDNGNPLFYRYTWIPKSETQFGQKNNFGLNFSVMQPIFTGGKIRSQYEITQRLENISKLQMEAKEAEVLMETEKLFWKLLSTQEKSELALEYRKMLAALLEDLQNIYEEGIISYNDLLRAQIAYNEADLDYFRAQNGISLLSKALARLSGLELSTPLIAIDTSEAEKKEFLLHELWQNAMQFRPELNMAEESIRLGDAAVSLAKARFYPDIALVGSYFAANPSPYAGLNNEWGHDYSVGISMLIPVFHWNERQHTQRVAIHERNALQLQWEDTRELVKLDISKAYHEYLEAQKALHIYALSKKQAQQNLEIQKDKFEVGTLTATGLLEAQILWQKASADEVEAKARYRESISAVKKAASLQQQNPNQQ